MTCTRTCRIPGGNGAHCGKCHESFGAVSTFDKHRQGGADNRHCIDPATIGMHRDAYGYWRRDSDHPHPHAGSAVTVTARDGENPSGVGRDTSGRPDPAETATARHASTASAPAERPARAERTRVSLSISALSRGCSLSTRTAADDR
jgi:hypothetical protein